MVDEGAVVMSMRLVPAGCQTVLDWGRGELGRFGSYGGSRGDGR